MIRRITTIATAVGCTGALIVPVAASTVGSAAAATSAPARSACAAVAPLRSSAITTQRDLGNSTALTVWTDPVRSSAWGGSRQLQLTLVKGDLATSSLDVRSGGFPGGRDPLALARQSGSPEPTALINGDFFDMFDTGDYSPNGPVVHGGTVVYAPYAKTLVAGQTLTVLPADEIQKVTGTVSFGRVSMPVRSVNGRTLPRNFAAIYDKRWTAGATLPAAAKAITIRNGVVSAITTNVAANAPRTPNVKVLLVPGALAAQVTSIRIGTAATIAVTATDGTSDKPRSVIGMSSTSAVLEGSLRVGSVTIPIGALNYHRVAGSTAAAFTGQWTDLRLPRAAATVVYDNGRIISVSRSGSRAPVPTGATVIQLPSSVARLATKVHVGDTASLSMALKTDSGVTFTEALGHGSLVLRNGNVQASCTWAAETDRPRTLMGWDDSGHVYFLVSTSGRSDIRSTDPRYSFRIGGATINEMATWLKAMGATNAINLDGGGSSILITKRSGEFQRVDLPKNSYRRPVPDAVALVPR